MARVVWKYRLPSFVSSNFVTIEMPRSANVLHVDWQRGYGAQLWACVDPDDPPVERYFRVFATGERYEVFNGYYVGSFLINEGELVFHVFEDVPVEASR